MAEKQKLTLSVEKDLVEKAKKLGVNISEITEIVLKHVSETETKDVVTKEEINAAYKKLFDAMLPAMKKFGASVEIGKVWEDEYHSLTVKLLGNGELWMVDVGTQPKFENVSFDPPKIILSTFIDSLITASERNKAKLKELEIFRRIIEALTETTVSTTVTSDSKPKRKEPIRKARVLRLSTETTVPIEQVLEHDQSR